MRFEERPRLSERMQGKASFSGADKRKLFFLAALLVLVVAVFVQLQSKAKQEPAAEPAQQDLPVARVAMPKVDEALLSEVRDATPEERAILEPNPFRATATAARILIPSHYRALENTSLPFETIEAVRDSLRGKPFRHHGRVVGARKTIRAAGAPEEYWAWIRTDDGHDLLFASLNVPDELFGSENFVRADGLFLKIYTWSYEGERVTAPLLVGRELAASYRKADPVREPDPEVLARVRDNKVTEDRPIDFDGKWNLMNAAHTLGEEPGAVEAAFAGATVLDREILGRMLNEEDYPDSVRGERFLVHCRVVDSWITKAGENPLRVEEISRALAGNSNWNVAIIRLLAPGRFPFPKKGSQDNYRAYYAWFLQMDAFETTGGGRRRAPVFVVAGAMPVDPPEAPPWIFQIMVAFLVLAVTLSVVIVIMIRRDRQQSLRASSTLERIRRRSREKREEPKA